MTTTATLGYVTVHREYSARQRQTGLERHHRGGYQRQPSRGGSESTGYYRQADSPRPDSGPATGEFMIDQSPDGDSLWMAGEVLTLADDQAAQIAQEAQADAAAMREAAEREAATIREAAQREAAETKARLDWMLEELSRILAAYITDGVAPPALPANAPTLPEAVPALLQRTRPAPDAPAGAGAAGTTSAPQATAPTRPHTALGTRPATAPTKRTSKPLSKEQRQGRQKNAMRFAKYGTAALLVFALSSASYMIADHGYSFFVFRENGQGDTPSVQPGRAGDNRLDSTFLAQQAAAKTRAAHHAPTGRHAKTSPPSSGTTATSTTGG